MYDETRNGETYAKNICIIFKTQRSDNIFIV